jgi:hypothetical protein
MKPSDPSFCEVQERVHQWASDAHLDPLACRLMVQELSPLFDINEPTLIFEAPGMTQPHEAFTVRNPRTEEITCVFRGWGTDLLTLIHELAHAISPWESEGHDEFEWDLTTLMLEVMKDLNI